MIGECSCVNELMLDEINGRVVFFGKIALNNVNAIDKGCFDVVTLQCEMVW